MHIPHEIGVDAAANDLCDGIYAPHPADLSKRSSYVALDDPLSGQDAHRTHSRFPHLNAQMDLASRICKKG